MVREHVCNIYFVMNNKATNKLQQGNKQVYFGTTAASLQGRKHGIGEIA